MANEAPSEEVVFGNTVESLFLRALGDRITPRCFELMAKEGIDLKSKLKPYYPRLNYYACVRLVAQELFPDLEEDHRMFEMGTAFMRGFEQTLLGRAILGALRWMGPKKTMAKMTQNFRSSNNYMTTDFREIAPNHVEVKLSQVSQAPGYFEGVLRKGLEIAGGKNIQVQRVAYDGTQCTYDIQWS